WVPMLIGLVITIILYLLRIPVVRASMPITKDKQDKVDMMFMSTMVPKGLAAAVLATIPMQQGIPGGELIKNIVFSIVLFSIIFTSVLIPLLEKSKATQDFYMNALSFNKWIRERIQKQQQKRAARKSAKNNLNTPPDAHSEAAAGDKPEDIKKE
ncbi:MAG: cation:proton antiporter, partial [Bacteroidales bacterium]|nr:cation:proton antiporter [Bacteroidales bacterium]